MASKIPKISIVEQYDLKQANCEDSISRKELTSLEVLSYEEAQGLLANPFSSKSKLQQLVPINGHAPKQEHIWLFHQGKYWLVSSKQAVSVLYLQLLQLGKNQHGYHDYINKNELALAKHYVTQLNTLLIKVNGFF